MRGPGTSKHCVTNMAADEEAAITAVIAAIFLVNKEEEENGETVLDFPNVLAVLYKEERRHASNHGLCRQCCSHISATCLQGEVSPVPSTFEMLIEMLTGCPEFTGGNEGVPGPRLMSASNL